jgi:hypothetical protein
MPASQNNAVFLQQSNSEIVEIIASVAAAALFNILFDLMM